MKKKKMVPNKLAPVVYRALEDIVGEEWISQDRAIVETYSKFSLDADGFLKKHEKDPSNIPACVVLPGSTDDVQSIVRVAHRYRIPFVPFANGQAWSGPTSSNPTICVHMSRMNKVLTIDEKNMTATLQAYADYGQLIADAVKVGLWNGGTPLATTLCKLSSQSAFAGIWQTSIKYGLIGRNIVSFTVVLPSGEILRTGSGAMAGAETFWADGPGPDFLALMRASGGTNGIITEITVKLHNWVGGVDFPEPPAGRPSIPHYAEPKYDSAPPPDKHRLYWIEFPDLDAEIKTYREIAHAGIGIGINASGVYSAYYCSQTQEMTEARVREKFFPSFNLYIITAAITSDRQLDYEDHLLREIVKENGGTFLSKDYKSDVLHVLAPWNLDCIRNVCGYRMNRRMYATAVLPAGAPEVVKFHSTIWREALETYGETHITDRGGANDTPFFYGIDPGGRFTISETDCYPDPVDPDSLHKAHTISLACAVRNAAERKAAPFVFGGPSEPLTSFFPEQGPNVHLLLRKFRKVFDPRGISSPGRQVFTEEEYKAFPEQKREGLNKLRQLYGLSPVKR